jgi:hypothetical protein
MAQCASLFGHFCQEEKGAARADTVAEMSLIICCFVAILPLFRRCYRAVFPLLSAAVFRAKREPDQSLERFWICFEKNRCR